MKLLSTSCFLLLFLYTYCSAEYIFYNKDNGVVRSLTAQEHAVVYPVVQRYTFPMNTNPTLTFFELSESDMHEMYQNEYVFLKKKLNGICDVQYIPTTLYELLGVRFWAKLKLMIPVDYNGVTAYRSLFGFPEARKWWENKSEILTTAPQRRLVREALCALNNLWRKDGFVGESQVLTQSFELYKGLNDLDDIQALHLIINTNILDYLESQKIDIEQLNQEETLQTILADLMDYFKPTERNVALMFSAVAAELALATGITNKELLSQAMRLEKSAWERGAFVLYRGTSGWEGRGFKIDSTLTCRRGKMMPNSISYGNSLFAAILGNDCLELGAMAYHYIRKSKLGYALTVDKYDYARGSSSELFHIPPLNTIVGLAGQGEFFHTRSKSIFQADDRRLCGIWFLNGAHQFHVPAFLISKIASQAQLEDQFSRYVVDNLTMLKNQTIISLEEFKSNQMKSVDETLHIDLRPDEAEENELEYTPSIEQLKCFKIFF